MKNNNTVNLSITFINSENEEEHKFLLQKEQKAYCHSNFDTGIPCRDPQRAALPKWITYSCLDSIYFNIHY